MRRTLAGKGGCLRCGSSGSSSGFCNMRKEILLRYIHYLHMCHAMGNQNFEMMTYGREDAFVDGSIGLGFGEEIKVWGRRVGFLEAGVVRDGVASDGADDDWGAVEVTREDDRVPPAAVVRVDRVGDGLDVVTAMVHFLKRLFVEEVGK